MTSTEIRCIARHLVTRYATSYELSVAYTCGTGRGGPQSLIRDLITSGALSENGTWTGTFDALVTLSI